MAGIKLAEWYLAAYHKPGGNVSDMSNLEKTLGHHLVYMSVWYLWMAISRGWWDIIMIIWKKGLWIIVANTSNKDVAPAC